MKLKLIPITFWSLLVIFSIPTISCETESASDVNQERIYTTYQLGYDSQTGQTEANATFYFGGLTGTVLELEPPSEVTINDLSMEKKTGLILFYDRDFPELVEEGTFRFTDANGKLYTNMIPLPESIDFEIPSSTISKSSDYVLSWTGEPIQQFESVSATISNNMSSTTFSETGVGATSITLQAEQLGTLENGQYTIVLRKSYGPPLLESPEAGGFIMSYYYSPERTLEVQD